MIIPGFHAGICCAGCRRSIDPEEVPDALVAPTPRLFYVVRTIHPRRRCLTAYRIMRPAGSPLPHPTDPVTVAELEEVGGYRLVGSNDDRGYARLEIREDAR